MISLSCLVAHSSSGKGWHHGKSATRIMSLVNIQPEVICSQVRISGRDMISETQQLASDKALAGVQQESISGISIQGSILAEKDYIGLIILSSIQNNCSS